MKSTLNRTEQLEAIELDLETWQKLYYKHQQDYIRRRLLAIKHLYEGQSRLQVCSLLKCTYVTLTNWIDIYLEGGLQGLVKPIKHKNTPQKLSVEQKKELKQIILEKSPQDFGIDRNFWTVKVIIELIGKEWNIFLKKSRIHEILHELNLSYQRAHRDYENADPQQQKQFAEELEKKLESIEDGEKVVFFDEFSVSDRPSIFYAWAEVNTRPEVPSDEKRSRNRTNGFMSVDAVTGQEYVILSGRAKSPDIASYIACLCDDVVKEGYIKITIILDNNSTHKKKMKRELESLLKHLGLSEKISVEFMHTPTYSPDSNLVEYLIHQLRLRLLHHLPSDITIEQIEEKLKTWFESNQLQTPQQIQNILNRILKLGQLAS